MWFLKLIFFPCLIGSQIQTHSLNIELDVTEEQPIGTILLLMKPYLEERQLYSTEQLNQMSFKIIDTRSNNDDIKKYLKLSASEGVLSVSEKMDREVLCSMQEECVKSFDVYMLYLDLDVATIIINLIDVNDNEPFFPVSNFFVVVPENEEVGARYSLPPAQDLDSSLHGIKQYRFSNQFTTDTTNKMMVDLSHYFDLKVTIQDNNNKLYLVLINKLASSMSTFLFTHHNYTMSIICEDFDRFPNQVKPLNSYLDVRNSSSKLSNKLELTIFIKDINNHKPMFEKSNYLASIREDSFSHSVICKVHAADLDNGDNGEVSYHIISINKKPYLPKNSKNVFFINSSTGVVTQTSNLLDREAAADYVVMIAASDHGTPSLSGTTTLTITITDVNDNPPRIIGNPLSKNGDFKVKESNESGSFVGLIIVEDVDDGNNSLFTCWLDTNTSNYFNIVPLSSDKNAPSFQKKISFIQNHLKFKVFTAVSFDFETTKSVPFSLHCEDHPSNSNPLQSSLSKTVFIVDQNDNPPIFTQSSLTVDIAENNLAGAFIANLSAMDADSGINGHVTYSLDIQSNHYFSIDATSGVLNVKQSLDYEDMTHHLIYVTARDHGEPALSSVAMVNVMVIDTNDNAPIFPSMKTYFKVLHPPIQPTTHTLVGEAKACDADAGDNALIHYSLHNITHHSISCTSMLTVNNKTGEIFLAGDLKDCDLVKFKMAASNLGIVQLQSETEVEVYVVKEGDLQPVITSPYGGQVIELILDGAESDDNHKNNDNNKNNNHKNDDERVGRVNEASVADLEVCQVVVGVEDAYEKFKKEKGVVSRRYLNKNDKEIQKLLMKVDSVSVVDGDVGSGSVALSRYESCAGKKKNELRGSTIGSQSHMILMNVSSSEDRLMENVNASYNGGVQKIRDTIDKLKDKYNSFYKRLKKVKRSTLSGDETTLDRIFYVSENQLRLDRKTLKNFLNKKNTSFEVVVSVANKFKPLLRDEATVTVRVVWYNSAMVNGWMGAMSMNISRNMVILLSFVSVTVVVVVLLLVLIILLMRKKKKHNNKNGSTNNQIYREKKKTGSSCREVLLKNTPYVSSSSSSSSLPTYMGPERDSSDSGKGTSEQEFHNAKPQFGRNDTENKAQTGQGNIYSINNGPEVKYSKNLSGNSDPSINDNNTNTNNSAYEVNIYRTLIPFVGNLTQLPNQPFLLTHQTSLPAQPQSLPSPITNSSIEKMDDADLLQSRSNFNYSNNNIDNYNINKNNSYKQTRPNSYDAILEYQANQYNRNKSYNNNINNYSSKQPSTTQYAKKPPTPTYNAQSKLVGRGQILGFERFPKCVVRNSGKIMGRREMLRHSLEVKKCVNTNDDDDEKGGLHGSKDIIIGNNRVYESNMENSVHDTYHDKLHSGRNNTNIYTTIINNNNNNNNNTNNKTVKHVSFVGDGVECYNLRKARNNIDIINTNNDINGNHYDQRSFTNGSIKADSSYNELNGLPFGRLV